MTDRRAFVAGTVAMLAAPVVAGAQQPVSRVGVIAPGSDTPGSLPTVVVDALRQGLQDHGYIEGRNIALEIRWDEGKPERNHELAREMVRLGVDVIVAGTTPSTLAAKDA